MTSRNKNKQTLATEIMCGTSYSTVPPCCIKNFIPLSHVVQDKVLCALMDQHHRGQKHSDTLVFLLGHYEASQTQCMLGCHYGRQCDAKQNKIKLNQGGVLNTDSTHWW